MSPIAEVGTAFVTLMPSAKGFGSATEKQVGGEMGKSGKSIGSKFGSAIKVGALAAVGGALAVGKFLGGALEEAREAQVVGARTENVIKRMGNASNISAKQVSNLAGAISLKSGVDDEAIQAGQNLLLTFGNIRNEAGKGNDIFNQTSQLMVDMSAAMGTDAKGSAIQLGKALNDPVKGLTALSRVGVSFTKQQTKQITKLAEGGKTMAAQKIILGELSKQFGGAAAAMATPGDKVAVAWGNVKEQIGTALLPTVDKLLGILSGKVIPAVSTFITQIQTGKGAGGQFAAAVMGLVGDLTAMWGWLKKNQDVVVPLVAAIGTGVVVFRTIAAVTKAWAAAQVVLNVAMTANPIGLIIAAIAALVVGLVVAYKKSETFRNIVNGALQAVGDAGKWLWENALKPAFEGIKAAISAVGAAGKWLWNNVYQPVFKFIVQGVARVLDFFGQMLQLIGKAPGFGWVGDLGDKLVGAAGKANDLANNIKDIPDNKTVNLNVNENWVTTRTVRGNGGGFGPQGLASGGIISRPTLALVGEGRESEAVMPLSKLSAMLDRERSATTAARGAGNVFHLYDADGALLGSMRGVVKGDRDNTAMRRRAGVP